jgi:hypothetical protein
MAGKGAPRVNYRSREGRVPAVPDMADAAERRKGGDEEAMGPCIA